MSDKIIDKKHPYYEQLRDYWLFWSAAYQGVDELLKLRNYFNNNRRNMIENDYYTNTLELSILQRNRRESLEDYDQRVKTAYGFDYSKSIVDMFSLYLFEKEPKRSFDTLANDELLQMFMDDCDLYGTDFDTWIVEQSRMASINGTVGILVDSPSIDIFSRAEQIKNNVYPYVVTYSPENILFWTYDRDANTKRPYLSNLVLQDGVRRVHWTREKIDVYEQKNEGDEYEIVESNVNEINEIPFFWLENGKGKLKDMGVSDLTTVARIDLSIIENLSQVEAVIKYAAFPLLRLAKEQTGMSDEVEVGPSAVIEFDPEGEKPDWLEPQIKSVIDAMLEWLNRKEEAIYQTANVGGISTTTSTSREMSGEAYKQRFRMLNAKLASKAEKIEEAELKIIYFWLKWQGLEDKYQNVHIEYPRDFNTSELEKDLLNLMTSKQMIRSELFKKEVEKLAARTILERASDETLQSIDEEIDAATTVIKETNI